MFHHREEVGPVILFLVEVWAEVCLDNLVDPLCFSICLGVNACGHAGSNFHNIKEFLPGGGCEPGGMIGYNVPGWAMSSLYFFGESSC